MNDRLKYLLDSYLKKTATASEIEEFRAMAGLPRYEMLIKAEIDRALDEGLEQHSGDTAIGEQVYAKIMEERDDRPTQRFFSFARTLAAAIVIFAIGIGWYALRNGRATSKTAVAIAPKPENMKTYRGKNFIRLPDGSSVMLKDGSELVAVERNGKFQREVILKGEAYFDIAHEAGHTFIVYADKVKTRVLGTAFNIRTQEGKVEVKVTRGLVEVGADQKVFGKLKAKEQIAVNTESNVFSITQLQPIERQPIATTALDFQEASYSDVFDQIGARFHYQVFLENPDLGHCRINANFTGKESLEDMLEVICATRNLEFDIELDKILIRGGTPCK